VQAQDGELTIYQIGDLLETALREDRIMPAYQPIFDLRSGEMVAEEALARIITINGGVMAAQQFIDVASEFQLTHKIDRAIVLAALRRKLFHPHEDSKKCLFVNFSAGLLRHPEMVKELLDYIKQTNTAHNGQRSEAKLVIEVTERELLENPGAAYQILKPFLDLGTRLALDDFGSGYSSFHYLADLPISFLKIDGNLIQRLDEPKVRAIVRGIQNTASELGLITLAECVETGSLAKHLIEIGINWGQGYHFSSVMLDEQEANTRRRMSANWAQGYYYRNPLIKGQFSSEQID
jgi:EAL domain-containing protein (putative c-di-GMP-specific phosphodiesterase class I)